MKTLLFGLVSLLTLASCGSSKDYLSRADDDKTIYDIVKKLNKQANDEQAGAALPIVYKQAHDRHLRRISSLNNIQDVSRWDKLYSEYNILQNMYDAIAGSDAASRLVAPQSFQNEIAGIKNSAAEDYYQLGDNYLGKNNRADARRAYTSFKKAESWVKGYKDSKVKMDDAYNSSIVTVIINPVQDNSFFLNTGWGNTGYNYSNEYFQQNLVRDLGGKYATRYPARFYTDWEARRENVEPDWVIDLTLRNMDIPRPSVRNYSRNVSKKIENGSDTSGKPIYKTVYATLNIQRQYFRARAQMDLQVMDVIARKNTVFNSFSDNYDWQAEVASFTGDRRALDNNDWAIINNSNFNMPSKEEILGRLYRNIYPQVKNRISNEVNW